MGGDEDQAGVRGPLKLRMVVILADRRLQGVDGGVARHPDLLSGVLLRQQVVFGQYGRSKIIRRDDVDRLAVEFLRPGRVDVARPQAGLNVADGDMHIEAGQRGGEGGGGVAVDQNDVRLDLAQDLLDPQQHGGGDVEQILLLLHDGQIVIRHDGKNAQDLIEHIPVLAGDADDGSDIRTFFQLLDERAHFDGLRPGTKYDQNCFHKFPRNHSDASAKAALISAISFLPVFSA